ncbi:NPC intracellular cholesterol transporter 2-like [Chrysoperla carnea]|uniref:NPC intracellular cholesterol transporter 2-like n=1 Tax=Chrysoperla carnea TaxID=189513 RepID=UPI001D09006E|nr:NPC intracellular cholesterol transporter 2-like [Chrysoperla carnea]
MDKNILLITFIFMIESITILVAVDVSECSKVEAPKPVHVDIKGCTEEPCLLPSGQNAIMDLTFVVPNNSDILWAKVNPIVFGIEGVFELPDPNVCNGLLNGYCPVDQNELLTYRLEMPVLKSYPQISLSIKLSIEDENRKKISCFVVKCKVVKE